jgi:hypothetical protein
VKREDRERVCVNEKGVWTGVGGSSFALDVSRFSQKEKGKGNTMQEYSPKREKATRLPLPPISGHHARLDIHFASHDDPSIICHIDIRG